MFTNAWNPVINGGTFTIMQGDVHSHYMVNDGRRLMELLQQHIAPGAFHNSDERYDPPKCHPHTRRAVLKKIMDWVKDRNKVVLFLWLYGPAGAGKSAIAQTIAELLEKEGFLAAAFFFSRNAAGRNDKTPLVPTLVYQLVKSVPEIRAHVLKAMEEDPAIFSCSIEAQIEALIVKPLNAVASDQTLSPILLSRPRFIILDGLDECCTTSAQTQILNALSTAAKNIRIPLCFLIASRPEQDIRQIFNDHNSLGSLSFSVALDDTYHPDDDIRVFLESTFDDIKRKHPSKAHFPALWPSLEDVQRLVKKSSGQFIFASTVAKYVNSHRHWPPDRLKIILGQSDPGQETPFAELDSVYRLILSSVADTNKLQDLLILLVFRAFSQDYPWPLEQTRNFIERFLFYRPGEIDMILTDLHSIIYLPPPGDKSGELRFFHASLPDFLLDRSRSKDLFLDQGGSFTKLTRLAVKHMNNPTESPLRNDQYDIYFIFLWCCVRTRPSPELIEDLCGLNLAADIVFSRRRFIEDVLRLMCWFGRQRLSPGGTETLLDHHSAIFDEWLQEYLMSSSLGSHFFAIYTLLDLLDPEEFNSMSLAALLHLVEGRLPLLPYFLHTLIGMMKANIEFPGIVSKFLMDQDRAGSLWVNSQTYVNLAMHLFKFLSDRRCVDIVDIHTLFTIEDATYCRIPMHYQSLPTYYDVGKLAFNLLPTLLSRIRALGGLKTHEITDFLQSQPPFSLLENDPLESQKVKAMQAIEHFLKR